jgi:hypothetical protein
LAAELSSAPSTQTVMPTSFVSCALFNAAVMSHYTKRGLSDIVAAVTGYFHSIACAANPISLINTLIGRKKKCYMLYNK